ncbi:MAG TPA: hypothetical protein VJ866_07735 [Pyrinomonadaceae bacterium]|nr:hypothetical protein [Pyrinomonadaceae bacterium]
MNLKSKPAIGAFLTACACALLAAAPTRQHAQEPAPRQAPAPAQADPYKVVVSYPPGAVGVFPEPLDLRPGEPAPLAAAWPAGTEPAPDQVWLLKTSLLDFRPEAEAAPGGKPPDAGRVKKLLAFTVPQLRRGIYVVSYDDPGSRTKRAMNISVEPQLQAEHGLLNGNPGDTVEVSFGLGTSYVAVNDRGVSQTRVLVTLSIADASVAELAPGQQSSQTTGEDGFATWKVRLKSKGETALRATAVDFEPAESRLVSAPRPTTTEAKTAEARADKAEAEADEQEGHARAARVESEQAEAAMLILKAEEAQGAGAAAKKEAAVEPARRRAALEEHLERSEAAEERAEARQASQLNESAAARATLTARSLSGAGGGAATPAAAPVETRPISPDQLLPGDIILMRGFKFYSTAILAAETLTYGRSAPYSHAALYVGGGMVAEMLGDGYNLHALGLSIDGATYADVYRWEGLSGAQRELIAAKGRSYAAGRYPYGWPQITVLGIAATNAAPTGGLTVLAATTGLVSGGDRQMICSEFVARAYHHAGLDPAFAGRWQVRFWPTLAEILLSDDRRHDYTTPNAIAVSPLLTNEGRLK